MSAPDSPTRNPHPYARFIPREELKGFSSWTPGSFGQPKPAAAEPPPEEPAPPPEPTREEWEERLIMARDMGYKDGYRDGLEALEAAKRQYAQQVSAQVGEVVNHLQAELQSLEDSMAQAVLETAVRLARQVVRSELAMRPEAVAQVAREAVAAVLLSAQRLRLRVNPEDLQLVREGAQEALASRDVVLQEDADIERGGCLVETDLGEVDAQVETRWVQAAGLFGLPVPWAMPKPAVEPQQEALTPAPEDPLDALLSGQSDLPPEEDEA